MIYKTAAELRAALQAVPDNAVVLLEGCDCSNPWNGKLSTSKAEDTLLDNLSTGTQVVELTIARSYAS